jgi:uncharacterized protein YndB with AHSA1/START domain
VRVEGELVELERHIAARPETVFGYFTDPERYRKWQGVDAELDPRPGGLFKVTMTGRTGVVARGEFVEVTPPERVVFTWGWEPRKGLPAEMAAVEPGTSMVEVTLIPDGDGTILRLRHSGLPNVPAGAFHNEGWSMSLDRLEMVAAGRDPGVNPFENR